MTQPSNSILFWVSEGSDLEHLFRLCCVAQVEKKPYEQLFNGLSSSWTEGTPESALRLGIVFSQQCQSVEFQHQPQSGESSAAWVFTTPTLTMSVSREGRGIVCTVSNWRETEALQQLINIVDNIVTMASVCKTGEPQDLRISEVIPFFTATKKKKKTTRQPQPVGAA